MRKVIIGLVSKHKEINKKRTTTYICDEMKDVLLKNGAIAIGILPTCHKNIIVDQENESQIFKNLAEKVKAKSQEHLRQPILLRIPMTIMPLSKKFAHSGLTIPIPYPLRILRRLKTA